MTDQCNTCFYGRTFVVDGPLLCAKSAPQSISTTGSSNPSAQWLQVSPEWWCGDFAAVDPQIYEKPWPIASSDITSSTAGFFSPAASVTSTVVACPGMVPTAPAGGWVVFLFPNNPSAALLTGVYAVCGTNEFTVYSSAAAGTELFGYLAIEFL